MPPSGLRATAPSYCRRRRLAAGVERGATAFGVFHDQTTADARAGRHDLRRIVCTHWCRVARALRRRIDGLDDETTRPAVGAQRQLPAAGGRHGDPRRVPAGADASRRSAGRNEPRAVEPLAGDRQEPAAPLVRVPGDLLRPSRHAGRRPPSGSRARPRGTRYPREHALEARLGRAGGDPRQAPGSRVPLPVHWRGRARRSRRGRVVGVHDAERRHSGAEDHAQTGAPTHHLVRVPRNGDRPRSRARRLTRRGPRGRSRPRGSARHLPQHAGDTRDRGARPHPLQAGQDPRLVLHRQGERGGCGRRGDRDGTGGRRHAAPPRHGRARDTRRRGLADLRAVHGPLRRPDGRQGRERPHGRREPRPDRDGQPPAGDAARRSGLPRSPSVSARKAASPSAGSARAPRRAATATRR